MSGCRPHWLSILPNNYLLTCWPNYITFSFNNALMFTLHIYISHYSTYTFHITLHLTLQYCTSTVYIAFTIYTLYNNELLIWFSAFTNDNAYDEMLISSWAAADSTALHHSCVPTLRVHADTRVTNAASTVDISNIFNHIWFLQMHKVIQFMKKFGLIILVCSRNFYNAIILM